MEMSMLFEKLAMIACESPELKEIFQILPPDLRQAIQSNDSLKLRSLIVGNSIFSDSVAVTYR